MRGLIDRNTSTSTTNTTIATLPSGYRPASNANVVFNVWGGGAAGRLDIKSDGTIVPQFTVTAGDWISFSGVQFSTL